MVNFPKALNIKEIGTLKIKPQILGILEISITSASEKDPFIL